MSSILQEKLIWNDTQVPAQTSMNEKPDVSRRERKANNQKMVDVTNLIISYVIS